jgi:DNA-binding transcriptional MerR regulator
VSSPLSKQHYRIGEVSRIVGVPPHVLRYWETEFRTIRPDKSTSGQRVYSRRDVEQLLWVRDLLKNQGFSIRGARKHMHDQRIATVILPEPNETSAPAADGRTMRRALLQVRQQILELLAELGPAGGPPGSAEP